MYRKAVSELISNLISIVLVLALSLVVFVYANDNFSIEYSKFNSVLDGFQSVSKNDLVITHAQLINGTLFLLLENSGDRKLLIYYIDVNSNSSSISLNLNATLDPSTVELFKLYVGVFHLDDHSSVTVHYFEEGNAKMFNESLPLV